MAVTIIGLSFYLAPATADRMIANQSVAQRTITRGEARLLFMMHRSRWPNGTPVTVFVLEDSHPLHQRFAKQALQLFPYQLRKLWDRQVFSGTGQTPIVIGSAEEMARRVESTPGAIGYADLPSGHELIMEIR